MFLFQISSVFLTLRRLVSFCAAFSRRSFLCHFAAPVILIPFSIFPSLGSIMSAGMFLSTHVVPVGLLFHHRVHVRFPHLYICFSISASRLRPFFFSFSSRICVQDCFRSLHLSLFWSEQTLYLVCNLVKYCKVRINSTSMT